MINYKKNRGEVWGRHADTEWKETVQIGRVHRGRSRSAASPWVIHYRRIPRNHSKTNRL